MASTRTARKTSAKLETPSPNLVRYRAGQVIFHEGEKGSDVFLILSGDIQITRTIVGEEHVFAELESGQFFGEIALFGHPRSATATASTNAQLLCFTRQVFLAKTQLDPTFALSLIEDLCNRLRGASDMIHDHLHDETVDADIVAVLKTMNLALHDSRPEARKPLKGRKSSRAKASSSRKTTAAARSRRQGQRRERVSE
jgi:CRP-like cAMP-binding protein